MYVRALLWRMETVKIYRIVYALLLCLKQKPRYRRFYTLLIPLIVPVLVTYYDTSSNNIGNVLINSSYNIYL